MKKIVLSIFIGLIFSLIITIFIEALVFKRPIQFVFFYQAAFILFCLLVLIIYKISGILLKKGKSKKQP